MFQRRGLVYGCLYSVGRRFLLTSYKHSFPDTKEQYEIRLSGRHVAYGETLIGKEYRSFAIIVHDLRTGKGVSASETGRAPKRAHDATFGNAFGIGPVVSVLARGDDIDPQSLGLHGDRLTWRQGGAAAHAKLGRPPQGRPR